MVIFSLVWLGQLVSAIGSRLTIFALGVWIYQKHGSVTEYALIYLFTYLPESLMSPFAGTLVDRWDRRWAMIISDSGAALGTLIIAFLLVTGQFQIWLLYPILTLRACFTAFQTPAYNASISQLVPKKHFSRVSGMVQIAQATSQIIAPMVAGFLVIKIKVQGVLFIDFCSFIFALFTLLLVNFPKTQQTSEGQIGKGSFKKEFIAGWSYILKQPGILALLIYSMVPYFTLGMLESLFTPLVLSVASTEQLGFIMSVGGCGWLVGSLVISIWVGPKRRIYAMFGFVVWQGLLLLLSACQASILLIASGVFCYLFAYPIILSSNQAIWLTKIKPDLQGRVFGVRRLIEQIPPAIAYIIAGPVVDNIFEPLFAQNGILAATMGQIISAGSGRGVRLLFMLMGIFNILTTVFAYQYHHLRFIDSKAPDIT